MYPKLDLYPTSQLIKLEWIRYANDEIVAFYHTWLPGSYGQLLFDEDLEHKNIYDILGGNRFGVGTMLVLSGNSRPELIECEISATGIIPDYIC